MSDYSYSELMTYRRCPKRYYYSRVRNLELAIGQWRTDLGSWMHELLADYYRGNGWIRKHDELQMEFDAEVLPYTDDDDVLGVPALAQELMARYVARYAKTDTDWQVLHVEESFVYEGIGFTPDLVVRTPGGIYVVDHKTSASIPEAWDLMGDYQHLFYVKGMRAKYGAEVKGAIFNYVRTKLPTPLRLNKTDGLINNVKRVDTTYEDLIQFAAENKIKPYPELSERLAELEGADRFMRRFQLLTPEHAASEALDDLLDTTVEIDTSINLKSFPRHVLPGSAGSRSCNACPYKELCQAELFGYDSTSAEMLYTERTPLGREYQEISA